MMTFIALFAVDLAMLPLIRRAEIRGVILGAMPMANVLAVYLATTVGSLRRLGEVALSRVMFVIFGGMALVLVVYLAHLTPVLVYQYLNSTSGLWQPPQAPDSVTAVFVAARLLLHFGAVTAPILAPALVAAWATRGYRLSLEKGTDGPMSNESRN
jgi:hypothetical protein